MTVPSTSRKAIVTKAAAQIVPGMNGSDWAMVMPPREAGAKVGPHLGLLPIEGGRAGGASRRLMLNTSFVETTASRGGGRVQACGNGDGLACRTMARLRHAT